MDSEGLEPKTLLAGRYRVERRLGEGGMGSVYLVEHIHTDERLALKVLHAAVVKDASTLERFRREARAPARIRSDHVVRVTDADVAPELGGVPFLVMEYLRGHDLDVLVQRLGSVPAHDVVLYLSQVARALDKAHAIGIVHRDLKPENVFLTTREDGTPWVKVLDFGIAKLTDAAGDFAKHASATGTGQIFGTPLYMAPEQAKAENAKIGPQTDVWALGLIAFRLLTGQDFWTATTLTHLIAQIAYEPMPAASERGSGFGPAFDAWFARACHRNPAERFPTAGEAVTALAKALGLPDRPAIHPGDAALTLASERERADSSRLAFAETAVTDSSELRGSGDARQSGAPLTRTQAAKAPRGGRPLLGVSAAVIVAGLAVGGGLFLRGRVEPAASDPEPAASAPPAPPRADLQEPARSPAPEVLPAGPATPPEPDAGARAVSSAQAVSSATPSAPSAVASGSPSAAGPKPSASPRPSATGGGGKVGLPAVTSPSVEVPVEPPALPTAPFGGRL